VFKATGVISDQELMTGYRRFGQRLQGHPSPAEVELQHELRGADQR
jgi:hypothetical protein